MKNGYYIHTPMIMNGDPLTGVLKKIDLQNRELRKYFDMNIIEVRTQKGKYAKRLLPGSWISYWDEAYSQIKDPAFIYIRKPCCDYGIIRFLKRIRNEYPETRILMEIPTYPYDREMFSKPWDCTLFLKDVLNRNRLRRFVDRIVTFSTDSKIFGIKTIPLINGTDVDEIKPRSPKSDLSTIHLLAIASFQEYHGYERVIQGMGEYYANGGKRNIILDFVGSGEVLKDYRRLSESHGITQHVLFHGSKYGEEAVPFFNAADIGLGAFGYYKINVGLSSALKTREYFAYGLPIVSGVKIDITEKIPTPYFMLYPNSPEPVNIDRLLRFYDKCYNSGKSCKEVINEIRSYAVNTVDIKKTFSPVIRYLLD